MQLLAMGSMSLRDRYRLLLCFDPVTRYEILKNKNFRQCFSRLFLFVSSLFASTFSPGRDLLRGDHVCICFSKNNQAGQCCKAGRNTQSYVKVILVTRAILSNIDVGGFLLPSMIRRLLKSYLRDIFSGPIDPGDESRALAQNLEFSAPKTNSNTGRYVFLSDYHDDNFF